MSFSGGGVYEKRLLPEVGREPLCVIYFFRSILLLVYLGLLLADEGRSGPHFFSDSVPFPVRFFEKESDPFGFAGEAYELPTVLESDCSHMKASLR